MCFLSQKARILSWIVVFVFSPPLLLSPTVSAQTAVDSSRTTRHFRVDRPADLSDADAMAIYDRILDAMVAGYGLSNDSVARKYRHWRLFNKAPYRSAQHGERYVNNYGNNLAADYGAYEDAETLPPGAVLVKDSFAVTARGDVFSGPLFIMKKESAGFHAPSRDWRYTMIMPDGSFFGTTNGEGSKRVEFCIACHEAGGNADHLFLIPEEYRVRFLNLQ